MNEPWTILHTEASNGWGGQEIRILSECRWMRSRGHRVLIAAPRDSEIFRRAGAENFELFHLPFKQATQALDAVRLLFLLKRLRPDFIATHSSSDTWAGLSAATLARGIGRVRYRHVSTDVKVNRVNRCQYNQLSNHVVTTGECIRDALVRNLGVPEDRITAVGTGIEAPTFLCDREQARVNLAERLGAPRGARFFGCVAVLRSWKGHTVLMKAFDQLAEALPDHHLALVGDGPGRESLAAFSQQLKSARRIHFLGHQSDPWPFFRAFDAAILASVRNEGIPQSLLQAMFAECPAVGTNVGGIPEIVRDGATGLISAPNDEAQLADAMRRTVANGDAARAMSERALAFVRSEYTLDRMGVKITAIYERVARAKQR